MIVGVTSGRRSTYAASCAAPDSSLHSRDHSMRPSPGARPVRLLRQLTSAAVLTVWAAACGPPPRPPIAASTTSGANPVQVRFVTDEAEVALALASSLRAGREPPPEAWARLFATDGYRRLRRRETGMGRPFADSAFAAFLRSDSLLAAVPRLEETLARWRTANVEAAAGRALAYLPPGTVLRAAVYPMIKPRPNSFVWDVGTDSAAIFQHLDPTVTPAKMENTIAHELHHVGFAAACVGGDDISTPERLARRLSAGLGEGLAMLAAAGSAEADPHAASAAGERARWERDLAQWPADLRRLDSFLADVATGRLTDLDSIQRRARTFYGDAQGAWYTVGYAMAVRVERAFGRDELVRSICDMPSLMRLYNQAVAGDPVLPAWSDGLLGRLDAGRPSRAADPETDRSP